MLLSVEWGCAVWLVMPIEFHLLHILHELCCSVAIGLAFRAFSVTLNAVFVLSCFFTSLS